MGKEQRDGAASGAEVKKVQAVIGCGVVENVWLIMCAQESGKVGGSKRGLLPIMVKMQMRQSKS